MAISANRSQFIWSPLLGWALLTCAMSLAQAQSETSSPARQMLEEQTPQVDVPLGGGGVGSTSGELGVSLGTFTLFPTLEVQVGFDNNVYATAPPTSGSAYALIKPELELKSEWLNHQLRLVAGAAYGNYPSASSQNFWNALLQADGRLDIRQDFYATGLVAVRRSTEPLGTPNTEFAQAPTVVDSIPVEFGLYQRFNRLFYHAAASATRYWYYDNSIISAGGLPAGSRNRTEYEERIRLGYEIAENVDIWVTPGLNQRVYEQFINAAGQQRDSRGWFVNVGATIRFTEKSTLEGYIGYTSLSYLVDGFSTPATTFGLSGSWNGYAPLVLRPSIIRTINESAYSDYQNYISTTIGLDFTYDIHDAWQAVGGTAINTADYNPAAGVPNVTPRTDYFWRSSLGLLYTLRPQVQIGPLYEHTTGWSTDIAGGGPSFSRDQFSVRLIAKR